jgi:hypothetical protein
MRRDSRSRGPAYTDNIMMGAQVPWTQIMHTFQNAQIESVELHERERPFLASQISLYPYNELLSFSSV